MKFRNRIAALAVAVAFSAPAGVMLIATPAFAWHANSDCVNNKWVVENPNEEWATNATFTFDDGTVATPVEPGQQIAAPATANHVTVTWVDYGTPHSYDRPEGCQPPEEESLASATFTLECVSNHAVLVANVVVSGPEPDEFLSLVTTSGSLDPDVQDIGWVTRTYGVLQADAFGAEVGDSLTATLVLGTTTVSSQTFTVPDCAPPVVGSASANLEVECTDGVNHLVGTITVTGAPVFVVLYVDPSETELGTLAVGVHNVDVPIATGSVHVIVTATFNAVATDVFDQTFTVSECVPSVVTATFKAECTDGEFQDAFVTIDVSGPNPGTLLEFEVQGQTTSLPWSDGTFGLGFTSGNPGDVVTVHLKLNGEVIDSAELTIPCAPAPTTTEPAPTTTEPAPTTTQPAPTTTAPVATTTPPAPTTTVSQGALAPTTMPSNTPLPSTGSNSQMAWIGFAALLAGTLLIFAARRRTSTS